jgi:hypothetical protein
MKYFQSLKRSERKAPAGPLSYFYLAAFLFSLVLASCTQSAQKTDSTTNTTITKSGLSDDQLLTLVQKQTFQYFWDGAEPTSGLARERIHLDGDYPQNDQNVITTGASGFGVMAVLVGIERGFITRPQGLERFEKMIGYLEKADRFHGAWPHWIQGETGKVKPFGRLDDGGDLVESAFLVQGLLCVRQYFKDGDAREKALASRINKLWEEVEWDWYRQGKNTLYWHWSPKNGWTMNFSVQGYNECLVMYVLAAASPTHTIPAEVYHEGWARSGKIKAKVEKYGYPIVLDHQGTNGNVGPLFWAHYSYLGLDPRGLKDRYADYWEHNKNHTLIHRAYGIENPKGFKGYGENAWGLTASYSPKGYDAHSTHNDLGVISPTAALSSFPYAPKESMQVIRHLYEDLGDKVVGRYGPYDAFSETENWYPQRYLGIDQGPIVVMIENQRSGLLWNLFMSCPEVQAGLKKLGFSSPQMK